MDEMEINQDYALCDKYKSSNSDSKEEEMPVLDEKSAILQKAINPLCADHDNCCSPKLVCILHISKYVTSPHNR